MGNGVGRALVPMFLHPLANGVGNLEFPYSPHPCIKAYTYFRVHNIVLVLACVNCFFHFRLPHNSILLAKCKFKMTVNVVS